jgi:aldehyde:ferredoxin oxidoreductase
MALNKGYTGRVLRVNLTTRRTSIEELLDKDAKLFLGGRGLGAKYLFDELKPGIEPLGEENKLYFLTGPLTATGAQSSSRWMVVTKSPLSGAFIRSTGGGAFGQELKSTGFDLVIIEGKAPKPTTIFINNDTVEFKDASHLWGKGIDTGTVQDMIIKELGDEKIQVACIGPAGENGTLYASIMNLRRSASRGGVGTVMGSKNIKAIAVRGTGKVNVADKEKLNDITRDMVSAATQHPVYGGFSHFGSSGITALMHEIGMHPVKNFQSGHMDDFTGLTTDKMEQIFIKDVACARCFIPCGSILQVKDGTYKGNAVEGPEYETMWCFGANINNTDLGFIVAANKLCDDHGIDTISAGVALSFTMELYEKGIVSKKDLDGIELNWGNHQAAYQLLNKIVKREGIGDLLALGTKKAAEKIGRGADKYAMHVKGLEIPAYEPRGAKAHGLNIATSTIGASHMTGYGMQELFGIPEQVDRFVVEGKGALTRQNQDKTATYDSLIVCGFPACFGWISPEIYAQLLVAATGIEEFGDVNNLIKAGERIYNLERLFNMREGLQRKDDYLPERFIKEPMPDGASKGQVFEMDMLLDDYYKARGWDIQTGVPMKEKLEELGLQSEAKTRDV